MGSFFNLDGPILSFINKAVNVVFLSVLWAAFCVPIITIGASTTALYYVTVKVIRRERGYVFKEFLKAFRTNFKQSTIIWLIIMVISIIFSVDLFYVSLQSGVYKLVISSLFNGMIIIVFCTSIYIFPNISRFNMKVIDLLKNSLFMAMKHLPSTITMGFEILVCGALLFGPIIIYMISFAKGYMNADEFVQAFASAINMLLLLLIIVPGLGALAVSMIMEKILKKYMPKKGERHLDDNGDEIIKDEWYLE